VQLVVVGEVVRGGPLVRGETGIQAGQRRHLHGWAALRPAGEHGDGATVDRAGGQRAADR
jgi:hypothetical protein